MSRMQPAPTQPVCERGEMGKRGRERERERDRGRERERGGGGGGGENVRECIRDKMPTEGQMLVKCRGREGRR